MMGTDIEVLVIPHCPHADAAVAAAHWAAGQLGVSGTPVRVTVVATGEQAHALSFPGSPTFLLDGTPTPYPSPPQASAGCPAASTAPRRPPRRTGGRRAGHRLPRRDGLAPLDIPGP